ncbi:13E12 repeat family protein [Nocardia yamanashiensis]|uniref:DUF222 domain-containing protein n=1 Tax=Nocardia yamanashiensis TaxID=209247 RepID=UPI001E42E90D|nr:DUF222 domain-containing protein [Nocardia yamanashiensis]UGT45412.1 13E12 repeat family protein [Nocardia yamanashiensis]
MFDSREVEAMGDEELIESLRRAHGAAAFAQAAEVTAVREVYRRHRAGNAAPGPGGVRAGEFAAAEVAVAVQVSEGVAAALIDIGLALDSLPQTKLAFAAGRIDLSRVQVIADCLRGLSREVRETLEPRLIEVAMRSDPDRLRQTAGRWVIRFDPEGEQRRREEREEDRDVRIRAIQEGMAVFDGMLPAAGAQTVAMRLREMSLEVCAEDPRSMPQRRADALVALADGSGRLTCACGRGRACPKSAPVRTRRRPLIQIGVSAETLIGLRDDPAYLSGHGPVDPALARSLAEHSAFLVIPEQPTETEEPRKAVGENASQPPATPGVRPATPGISDARIPRPTGPGIGDARVARPVHVAPTPYERALQASMRRHPAGRSTREVKAADGTCRFPGCPMPAAETVLAQVLPISARQVLRSTDSTRASLCGHHYRLKTMADRGKQPWRVYLADPDHLRWIDPTGEPHETVREGARYLFPHTDFEAPARPAACFLRPVSIPPEPPAARHSYPVDLAYPLEDHVLIHPQLSRCTPDNDLPDATTRAGTR